VLTSWLGGTVAAQSRAAFAAAGVPSFESPEEAVRAFSHLACFHENQTLLLQTPGAGVAIGQDRIASARGMLKAVRAQARTTLTEPESKRLLALFGIPTVETRTVETPAEAAAAFDAFRSAVAVKILSPDITHKSDSGGVALNLKSAAEVETAAALMLETVRRRQPEARIAGFTIQPMIARPKAQELILGIARDPTFGPVILFGRGGIATEVIADRAIGLPPLNSVLAHDMIARTRVSKLLAGFRNVPPVPLEPIVDVLLRLSELAVQLEEIVELDINPLLSDADGVIALDARIVIGKEAPGASRLAISPYPHQLEREIALADGTLAHLRPIRPEDETALAEMVARCTPEDLRKRFLAPLKTFPHETAARLSQIDYDREMALVAVEPGSAYGAGPIMGVVRIFGDPERDTAEYAILVRSDLKGRGLGYELMRAIIDHARSQGYRRICGEVFRHNRPMLQMANELGFATEPPEDGSETSQVVLAL
jgi:acetyltransferase